MTFNVGDRVRFTWPKYSGRGGEYLDGTIVRATVGDWPHVVYDTYGDGKVCTPQLRHLTLIEQPVDETESFFV